jgi:hypothetical protein
VGAAVCVAARLSRAASASPALRRPMRAQASGWASTIAASGSVAPFSRVDFNPLRLRRQGVNPASTTRKLLHTNLGTDASAAGPEPLRRP